MSQVRVLKIQFCVINFITGIAFNCINTCIIGVICWIIKISLWKTRELSLYLYSLMFVVALMSLFKSAVLSFSRLFWNRLSWNDVLLLLLLLRSSRCSLKRR